VRYARTVRRQTVRCRPRSAFGLQKRTAPHATGSPRISERVYTCGRAPEGADSCARGRAGGEGQAASAGTACPRRTTARE
jgi:hypothetical protein